MMFAKFLNLLDWRSLMSRLKLDWLTRPLTVNFETLHPNLEMKGNHPKNLYFHSFLVLPRFCYLNRELPINPFFGHPEREVPQLKAFKSS